MAGKKAAKRKTVKKRKAQKAKEVTAKPKKTFYVGVSEPLVKQREILQVTAEYLRMLQNIEKLKKIHLVKQKLLTEFSKQMSVLRTDSSNLYKLLPKYNFPKKVNPFAASHRILSIEPVKKRKVIKKVKPKTEMDLLEAELAEIEGRLSSL